MTRGGFGGYPRREAPQPPAALRRDAQKVLAQLQQTVSGLHGAGPDGGNGIHALFAELYLCTTKHWLAKLETHDDGGFTHRFMVHFLELYKIHVIARLDAPLETVAPHWRLYHRLSRWLSPKGPLICNLLLVSIGIRAHTHHDLARAVLATEEEFRLGGASARAAHFPDEIFFGTFAEDAFLAATREYVERQRAHQTGWRRHVLGLYLGALILLRPIWMRVLQYWRRSGFAKRRKELPRAASRHDRRPSTGATARSRISGDGDLPMTHLQPW